MTQGVRLLNAAIDVYEGHTVLRGSLDPATLDNLLVDDYQRDVQPVTSLARIMRGFDNGSAVPDTELGMRGSRKSVRDGVYTLFDPVYIVDGLQRISAAKRYRDDGKVPHLGATIHFNTTKEWERKQFKILNADRVRVSSNILLRNFRADYDAVNALYRMTNDERDFVLCGKVCWDQRQSRTHLVTAMTFAKVSLVQHTHVTCATNPSPGVEDLCGKVEALSTAIGKNTLRANVRAFYEVVNECWPFARVAFTEKSPFVRATFLLTLARVFSGHEVFWREKKFFVEVDLKRKLADFPIFDPWVVAMTSKGSMVEPELFSKIVEHLNKGKRTRHLKPRVLTPPETDSGSENEEEEGERAAG